MLCSTKKHKERRGDKIMTNINTCLIVELEELQIKRGLTALEQDLLDAQYRMIDEVLFKETDIYGDLHQY